jgi:hypothetical protein
MGFQALRGVAVQDLRALQAPVVIWFLQEVRFWALRGWYYGLSQDWQYALFRPCEFPRGGESQALQAPAAI